MDMDQPLDWLKQAGHFNTLWHHYKDMLNQSDAVLSGIEQQFYRAQAQMLLQQKQHYQIQALRLTYRQYQPGQAPALSLEADYEKSSDDDQGLLYRFRPRHHNDTLLQTHIPQTVLQQRLSADEWVFFGLNDFSDLDI